MGIIPLKEGTAAQGGVLVPAPVREAILGRLGVASVVRRLAQVIPMSSLTLSLPRLVSGVAAQWVAEGDNTDVDAPTFDSLLLTAHKLAVLVPVTEELIADANSGIAGVVAQLLADSFAAKEDMAFLGFDTGGPITGIYQGLTVPKTPSTGDIVADTAAALAAIEGAGYSATGFVTNPSVKSLLRAAKDGDGRFIFSPSDSSGTPDMLWGLPVIFSRQVPVTLGTGSDKTAILAGDWKQFIIGDRRDFTLSRSGDAAYAVGNEMRSAFQRHEVLLRAEERVDGLIAAPTAFAVVDLV
ncbi:MAG: phage major capsid protein [bacterium]